jgi:7-cyano-7-deazaguanine synthase
MGKVVVLLSGGMDSTVLLAQCIHWQYEVEAIGVDYGQRHVQELAAALNVAEHYAVPYRVLDMSLVGEQLFQGAKSSQVGDRVDVPLGHYADESMKTTVVPNRNMVLISLAGARAAAINADLVAYAAHAGDHAIYPDCRPEFAVHAGNALYFGNDPHIKLLRPFIDLTKTEICRLGYGLGVPFELTWSCYAPQLVEGHPTEGIISPTYIHCGKCGTCVERREAFRDSKVPDPTSYVEQVDGKEA